MQWKMTRCWTVASLFAVGSLACDSASQHTSLQPTGPGNADSQSPLQPSSESVTGSEESTRSGAPSTMSGTAASPGSGGENLSGTIGALAPAGVEAAGSGEDTSSASEPPTSLADAGINASSTFHVFLLLGQSNMAGYPKAQQADRAEDPRIRVLGFDDCAATGRRTDVWDVAAPPLHECWNDGLGPGDYFAKTLLARIPEGDSIGLVPSAISGERIEAFLKVGGTRYDRLIARARLAQQAGGVIEGILFHQGESNNGDPSWPGKVNTLITDLRADLGIGAVPFLAGELLYVGGAAGHNRLVNQLPGMLSNAYVISADGLALDPADTEWNLHFDHDSQVEFGKRYAQTMLQALGW